MVVVVVWCLELGLTISSFYVSFSSRSPGQASLHHHPLLRSLTSLFSFSTLSVASFLSMGLRSHWDVHLLLALLAIQSLIYFFGTSVE